MTKTEFYLIMHDDGIDDILSKIDYCNALMGLKIIEKYCPGVGIEAADHDIIYSVSMDHIFKSGITRDDAVMLRKLNWIDEEGYLACFV